MTLLERAIEAQGGRDAWHRRHGFEIELTAGGAAWPLRTRPAPGRFVARLKTAEPWTEVLAFGGRGVFEPGRVRIEDGEGRLLAERHDPRAAFRRLRQKFHWDDLDLLYFSGYALWNYMAFPFLLEGPGFEVEERPGRVLAVRFPDGFPAHSREQLFYLDDRYRLVRNDYTAFVFGSWARGRHMSSEHREMAGLVVPTRRRVHPRMPAGRLLTIVSLDIHRVSEWPAPA